MALTETNYENGLKIEKMEEQLEIQQEEIHQLRAIASEKTAEVTELTRELEQLRRAVRYGGVTPEAKIDPRKAAVGAFMAPSSGVAQPQPLSVSDTPERVLSSTPRSVAMKSSRR